MNESKVVVTVGTCMICFFQDVKNRRNPRLVPYSLLDERTKKSNKDSLREAVRTLLGYGYNLEAPDQDHGIGSEHIQKVDCSSELFSSSPLLHFLLCSFTAAQSEHSNMSDERFRIFRAEKTYAVNAGKWYFELEVKHKTEMLVIVILFCALNVSEVKTKR